MFSYQIKGAHRCTAYTNYIHQSDSTTAHDGSSERRLEKIICASVTSSYSAKILSAARPVVLVGQMARLM